MEEKGRLGRLPKVLIVDLSKGYGGATSRVLTLIARSEPGSIGLACLKNASVTRHALALGVPTHIVGNSKIDPAILFSLIRVIRNEMYDLLDSQNIQSKFWASLASVLTTTPLVSTIHSWYSNEHGRDSLKGRLYTELELLTNLVLDLYITVSEKDRQSLLAAHIPKDRIELIYNAVDIDELSVTREAQSWLRDRFSLPPHSIVCTAVGRLVEVKNHQMLVTAMQEAITQVPELTCLIVGEGELKENLENQIAHLGLEKHVILTGFLERSDVLAILRASDIYVMPSRYEGTPITLLEAAALGIPILSTYAGGIPELVSDKQHALLVSPEDAQGLARALVKLARDREYAQALGCNAQQHIREFFSLEQQMRLTWQAYQKARNRHGK